MTMWTTKDMEKDSGKGDQGQRDKVMGRGGGSSEGQNHLEGETMRPNYPLGETWKMMIRRRRPIRGLPKRNNFYTIATRNYSF